MHYVKYVPKKRFKKGAKTTFFESALNAYAYGAHNEFFVKTYYKKVIKPLGFLGRFFKVFGFYSRFFQNPIVKEQVSLIFKIGITDLPFVLVVVPRVVFRQVAPLEPSTQNHDLPLYPIPSLAAGLHWC